MIKNLPGGYQLRKWVTRAQGWWYDTTRHVDTSGYVRLDRLTLVGSMKTGHEYLAGRPGVVRPILRSLPISNHADYTFVDLGSGKGRVLFLAAEYPFRKIEGVEFARELHETAVDNIRRYRHPTQRCRQIESLNADAADYAFPKGNLVVYLFNPFGPNVMEKVLSNLAASIRDVPRHVIVVIVWPELAFLADETPWLRLHSQAVNRHRIYSDYRIYQTPPQPARAFPQDQKTLRFLIPDAELVDLQLVHGVLDWGREAATVALMIS